MMAELPLALFTTLAPIGAGAFIALAVAFFTTKFSDEQLKKIDRMTTIPVVVLVAGFICAFFHLASPMHAFGVFAGLGASPLSNELLAGVVFAVLAIVYWIVALAGKLGEGARKGFAAVVAVMAVVFACFTGAAYMMETIASWNTPMVPVAVLGFSLMAAFPWGCSCWRCPVRLRTLRRAASRWLRRWCWSLAWSLVLLACWCRS